jgi:hypothetical protein
LKTYPAPWSPLLKAVSAVATVICLAIVFMHPVWGGKIPLPVIILSEVIPLALLAGCALFIVRGFVITPDAILVKRLLWNTRLPRAGLQSATYSPALTRGSVRTFGNGGLYSFTGWYWNQELGRYRAFVTDHANIVVLRYPESTMVLSPGDPEAFVKAVTEK